MKFVHFLVPNKEPRNLFYSQVNDVEFSTYDSYLLEGRRIFKKLSQVLKNGFIKFCVNWERVVSIFENKEDR